MNEEQKRAAKEILRHAFSDGRTILEVRENESGENIVMDITEHVEQLEKMNAGT